MARASLLEQQIARGDVDAGSNNRHEIALLAAKDSIGGEFGVDTGQLSARFLNLGHFSSFHCVDKWDDQAHPRDQYLAVCQKLMKYQEARIWRMTAQEFARLNQSVKFGFIYIDCYAHTGQNDGEVLDVLWPLLEDGGIFAGDDYDERAWPHTFGAVNRFAAASVGRIVNIRDEHVAAASLPMDKHPSWWIRK